MLSASAYISLSSLVVLIGWQFGFIVVTEFESEFGEAIISVPAVQIQPDALLDVRSGRVCGGLIEHVISNNHADLIRANEMVYG